jgi:flavin reductase (DIM6/NTAB) family NADH-FMN oxidoreductase RutF
VSSAEPVFSELTGDLDHPMFVVTTVSGAERAGCLVGFATQCSIAPARFLACLSDKNYTFRVATRAHALAVHVLPAAAMDLAELFGGETGDDIDKFARCRWHEGPEGLPILDRCQSWFVGLILGQQVFGDHIGFLLEPVAVRHDGAVAALSSLHVSALEPGHSA